MITAMVDGALRLRIRDVRPTIQSRLVKGLSFPNPELAARLRFGAKTADIPPLLRFFRQTEDELLLPRGAAPLLREAVASERETLSWVDRRVRFEPRSVPLQLELRPYQGRAVTALVEKDQGFAVVPCGGGKTVIGVAAICATGQPALVIVHTRELLAQWQEAFRRVAGVEAGTIAEGKVEPGHFTVATVQTLAKLDDALLATLGRDFGAVVVDELHHIPAVTFQRVLPFFAARYLFGLTATPFRSDGLSALLPLCIGPRRFQIGHNELVAAGHLVIPRVVPLRTGVELLADSHAALVSGLVEDVPRNELIVSLVEREARAGHSVLVLSGRVAHCDDLAEQLVEAGTEAVAVTGEMPHGERTKALDRFREGSLPVVCATSLADEGLDVSRLERLVLASPSRAEGRTIQRLGRLMRPHPGKQTPVLYDLVDADRLSQRQFLARKRAYRKVLGPNSVEPVRSQP